MNFWITISHSTAFCIILFTSLALSQGNTWTTKADMEIQRYQHSTCAVNGKIYVIGGATTGGCNQPGSQSVEEYDPSTNTWMIKEPMPTGRESLSISAVNGKIYAIGGDSQTCSGELSTVEEYDPLTNSWSMKKNMQVPRTGLSTCVVSGKIYAIGGWKHSTNVALKDVEEYDPVTNTWTTKADMLNARTWFSTSVVDGKIYVFGGRYTSELKSVEVYDPVTNEWSPKNDMPIALGSLTASTVNDLIYIFGGLTSGGGSPRPEVREYNPISDTLKLISQMPSARCAVHSSELNGDIYVIAGSRTNWPFTPTKTVQVYTPPDPNDVEDTYRPEEYALDQNYPNPFNPVTTISYQIPEFSFATLKVYDVLGSEVVTLVNEEKPIGSYEVEFSATDGATVLPSGVYFYRLQVYPANVGTGNFIETMKMVLMK
jgi:N-acetylneuraminic acid mutarotase